ncbi:MAG: hypothetical protein JNK72_17930 [Myxococcales bacterium]|nr:hypothetical protein [Myxococcales bacterium]
MQKPKFRTVEKSAWVFVTTKLNTPGVKTMNRRTALRCGYLTAVSNLLGVAETELPTPKVGESMSHFVTRVKSARA